MAITWSGTLWATLRLYAAGDRVVNGPSVYGCTVGGISANAGPGPTGTTLGVPITDGAATWLYLGVNGGAVIGIAPALSTATALEQGMFLDIADKLVQPDMFLSRTDMAKLYLCAHLGTISKAGGKGAVTASSVGPLSRSYSTVQGLKGTLQLSSYGATFAFLQNTTSAGLGL